MLDADADSAMPSKAGFRLRVLSHSHRRRKAGLFLFPLLAGTCVQPPDGPTVLVPDQAVEATLTGPQVRDYSIELQAGAYLSVSIDQINVDVVAALSDPSGATVLEVDQSEPDRTETVRYVCPLGGVYRLRVRQYESLPQTGHFGIQLEEPRPPTEGDRAAADLTMGKWLLSSESSEQKRQALPLFREVLAAAERLKDTRLMTEAALQTAGALAQSGKGEESATLLDGISGRLADLGDIPRQVEILLALAGRYDEQGQSRRGWKTREEALGLARKVGDSRALALALVARAEQQRDWNAIENALDDWQAAIPIWRDLHDRVALAAALRDEGKALSLLGRLDEARQRLDDALQIRRELGLVHHVSGILSEIGWTYYLEREDGKALAKMEQAAQLLESNGLPLAAGTLDRWGSVLRQAGNLPEAKAKFLKALEILKQDSLSWAHTQANLGEVLVEMGLPLQALDHLERALPVFQKNGVLSAIAHARTILAKAQSSLGNLDEALKQLEAVSPILESVRSQVVRPTLRDDFQRTSYRYQLARLDLLMRLHQSHPQEGYDLRALALSERNRARNLEDAWEEGRRESADAGSREREDRLRASIQATDLGRIGAAREGRSDAAAEAEQELRHLYLDLEKVRAATLPQRQAAVTLDPKDLPGLLDPQTVLLYYSLGKDQAYAWLIERDSIGSYVLPASSEDIEDEVRRCQDLFEEIAAPQVDAQIDLHLRQLYERLLAPFEARLEGKKLLLVPDSWLQYVPFQALRDRHGDPLVRNHEISYLTSASSLVSNHSQAQEASGLQSVAVFSDPVFEADDPRVESAGPGLQAETTGTSSELVLRSANDLGLERLRRLPQTRREARAILEMTPEQGRFDAFGFEASLETVLRQDLTAFDELVFSTHSLPHPRYPELSGIVLSMVDRQGRLREGFLRAQDVPNIRQQARLVVLSGCQTRLGRDVPGQGMAGLPQSFLESGVSGVVVSLWKVGDTATAELMIRFHRALSHHQTPAAALRSAQLSMLDDPRFSSARQWAGFILLGQ